MKYKMEKRNKSKITTKNKNNKRKRSHKESDGTDEDIGPMPDSSKLIELNSKVDTMTSNTIKIPRIPLTKEEFEYEQNKKMRVLDPGTGRMRLMKKSGEIIEEIISKTKHKSINKKSTLNDGLFYLNQALKLASTK